ncbi:hypothetical protein SCLCIDRAFT_172069 [Scleroderma citrinum Foug A]|uniref:Uncharacterized protein n=1 Tax=Scleroderma citrinum Foug A TaxID=1036808 RepID=A0A0C3B0P9_9AGAM|nr:hypothetical protein SCLCIDRAFT_172069 [Scleroderma citrinum Foug A]
MHTCEAMRLCSQETTAEQHPKTNANFRSPLAWRSLGCVGLRPCSRSMHRPPANPISRRQVAKSSCAKGGGSPNLCTSSRAGSEIKLLDGRSGPSTH